MTSNSAIPSYNATQTIAVVGATGQQGGATARALLSAGAIVRGLTRNVDSDAAKALAAAGAEMVTANLADPSSVTAAFVGASHVFAMTTMTGPAGVDGEVEHGRVIADAAVAAGVSHVVYSSVGGAERHTGIPHFESKRRVEEYLAGLAVHTTFIRPVFFMENLLGTNVEGDEVVVRLPFPDGIPLQMVAVDDIGRVAAAVLLDPASVDGSVEIAGDELTGTQIAEVFGRHAGRPARYEALPIAVLDGDFDMKAMFEWFTESVAYQADREATRALDPEVMDTAAWLATTNWNKA